MWWIDEKLTIDIDLWLTASTTAIHVHIAQESTVCGMGWDMPADAGLTAFDSRSRLAAVSCKADCKAGGVNRLSVWDLRHNNA